MPAHVSKGTHNQVLLTLQTGKNAELPPLPVYANGRTQPRRVCYNMGIAISCQWFAQKTLNKLALHSMAERPWPMPNLQSKPSRVLGGHGRSGLCVGTVCS